ncbi:hypothetical protein RPALISO_36 [Ruegeria phage RpAliso]|nr:hypothetical protein RPALISO_36 [Ruegeria phage RpAliso]
MPFDCKPPKKARERYSLKPYEKRTILQYASGKTITRAAMRGLATQYGCSLKSIHDVLLNASVDMVDVGTKREKPGPSTAKKPRKKLSIAVPKEEQKEETSQEVVSDEHLIRRKLELDRREREMERREDSLRKREAIVSTKEADLDEALRHVDDAPDPEDIRKRDAQIADLQSRLNVLSGKLVNTRPVSRTKLYAEGIVKQLLLVKDAEIASLRRKLDAEPTAGLNGYQPESLWVL